MDMAGLSGPLTLRPGVCGPLWAARGPRSVCRPPGSVRPTTAGEPACPAEPPEGNAPQHRPQRMIRRNPRPQIQITGQTAAPPFQSPHSSLPRQSLQDQKTARQRVTPAAPSASSLSKS